VQRDGRGWGINKSAGHTRLRERQRGDQQAEQDDEEDEAQVTSEDKSNECEERRKQKERKEKEKKKEEAIEEILKEEVTGQGQKEGRCQSTINCREIREGAISLLSQYFYLLLQLHN